MRNLFLVLSLVLFSAVSFAQTTGDLQIVIDKPTSRLSGAPLPASEIQGYKIFLENTSAGIDKSVFVTNGDVISYTFAGLDVGDWKVQVVAWDVSGCQGIASLVADVQVVATKDPIQRLTFSVLADTPPEDPVDDCVNDDKCTVDP